MYIHDFFSEFFEDLFSLLSRCFHQLADCTGYPSPGAGGPGQVVPGRRRQLGQAEPDVVHGEGGRSTAAGGGNVHRVCFEEYV